MAKRGRKVRPEEEGNRNGLAPAHGGKGKTKKRGEGPVEKKGAARYRCGLTALIGGHGSCGT